jgi:hypothetical protein
MDYLARCHAVLQAGETVVDVAVSTDDDYPRRSLTPDKLIDRLPGLMGAEGVEREKLRLANAGQPQRELPAGVRASANIPDPGEWLDPLRGYKYDSLPSSMLDEERYAFANKSADPTWDRRDLASAGVPRDFEPIDGIAWNHRKGTDWDTYFVTNQRTSPRTLDLSLRATGAEVEVWDPNTGDRRRVNADVAERTELSLDFAPAQSLLVVVRDSSDAALRSEPTTHFDIRGPWRVAFSPVVGATPPARSLTQLNDLTSFDDLNDFVGEARYETDFDSPSLPSDAKAWIDIGAAAALAEVRVNGVNCGVAWTAPWRVNVTPALRAGRNELTITTSSTWKNRLVAERELPAADRVAWTSAPVRVANNNATPLGLFGPVRLLIEQPLPQE